MSKNAMIIIVVVLVLAVAGLLVWYFMDEEDTSTPSTPSSTTNTEATTNVEIVRPPENTVWIMDGSFTPSELTVSVGDTVTWVNKDEYKRGVASDPDPTHDELPELVSNELDAGESFSFSFETEGEWGYHDFLNPVKRGKIIVE